MHDVASHCDVNCMCSKDVQKQLAQTSLKTTFSELFCGETVVENKLLIYPRDVSVQRTYKNLGTHEVHQVIKGLFIPGDWSH